VETGWDWRSSKTFHEALVDDFGAFSAEFTDDVRTQTAKGGVCFDPTQVQELR
jgi:hypothetical protein